MTPPPFLASASQRLAELAALACPGQKSPGVLVALSGGPDSVALLLAAHHWAGRTGSPLEAAHLDHRLRGEHSDGDAAFCADLCRRLDIPLHVKSEDPRPLARRRGMGLEEAGRTLRLEFLQALLSGRPHLGCVAKGQHRDDQAETVVMRLFRGAGLDGLAGIRPVQGRLIHPLLEFSRQEILDFLAEVGQPWRQDATNLTGDNVRSRLRRELMPLVRDIFGEGCDRTPARTADLLTADRQYLEAEARRRLGDLREPGTPTPGLQVDGLQALPAALAVRVLRTWLVEDGGLDPARLESSHLLNILDWLGVGQSGGGWDLPGHRRLLRDFAFLRCAADPGCGLPLGAAADFRVLVARTGEPEDARAAGLEEGAGRRDQAGIWSITCPSDVLQGNLRVRNPRPGDRFQPFGLDGTRKLSDLFREQRIAEAHRGSVLIVTDDAGILWVAGLARSERTRLLPSSGGVVTISVARR